MKKVLSMLLLIIPLNVLAVNQNSAINVNSYNECFFFQEQNKKATGSGYFANCKQAKCTNGVWHTYPLYVQQGTDKNLVCANGNTNYYNTIVKTTCNSYVGECSLNNDVKYCGEIIYYDCNKVADGSTYVNRNPEKPTTTIPPITNKPTTSRKPQTSTKPSTTTTTTTTTTAAPKDNNSFLKELLIEGYNINFNKEILSYDIEVKESVVNLNIKYEAESAKAKVELTNITNIDKTKPVVVKVTAEDGTFKEYTINIKTKILSNNKNVNNIRIDGHDLNFNPYKFEYDLVINNSESELSINVELEDEKSSYIVEGNYELINGSVIIIKVSAEDGSAREYKINIIKEATIVKKKSNGGLLKTIIILIILVVIGLFGFRFIKNNMPGKKDDKYDYE